MDYLEVLAIAEKNKRENLRNTKKELSHNPIKQHNFFLTRNIDEFQKSISKRKAHFSNNDCKLKSTFLTASKEKCKNIQQNSSKLISKKQFPINTIKELNKNIKNSKIIPNKSFKYDELLKLADLNKKEIGISSPKISKNYQFNQKSINLDYLTKKIEQKNANKPNNNPQISPKIEYAHHKIGKKIGNIEFKYNILNTRCLDKKSNINYKDHKNGNDEESDHDSFVDDNTIDDEYGNYSDHIKAIFGYDKKRYANEIEIDDVRETSFKDQMKEEARSTRIGKFEDLEDIKLENEHIFRKRKRKII
ncbi:unnamed protein product [Gordionus sp. m RMFG-2023]|uniref:uncharacterized protein LOC135928699 n=1 Tax=Gordionus sp. m RMFG-2023 TaxID=3053472 RepID=UPI0030DF4963